MVGRPLKLGPDALDLAGPWFLLHGDDRWVLANALITSDHERVPLAQIRVPADLLRVIRRVSTRAQSHPDEYAIADSLAAVWEIFQPWRDSWEKPLTETAIHRRCEEVTLTRGDHRGRSWQGVAGPAAGSLVGFAEPSEHVADATEQVGDFWVQLAASLEVLDRGPLEADRPRPIPPPPRGLAVGVCLPAR